MTTLAKKIPESAPFEEWALVEIMGHVKLAGKVSEATMFGTALCRVDVYPGDATEPLVTRMYGGSSIYCITPVSEATARAFALGHQPEPVARWELPAPAPARREPDEDEDEGGVWPGGSSENLRGEDVDPSYDQPSYR